MRWRNAGVRGKIERKMMIDFGYVIDVRGLFKWRFLVGSWICGLGDRIYLGRRVNLEFCGVCG